MFKNFYTKSFIRRFDDEGYLKYYSEKDFKGLNKTPYPFTSGKNSLQGYFYNYDNYDNTRILIFCHGYGGGHRSYMQEINFLAKSGLQVLTFDITGCFESQGENIHSMTQSLCDLKSLIDTVKTDPDLKNKKISVMGHSWGGYAALNILNFYDDLEKIVSVSPFISLKSIISQSKLSFLYLGSVMKIERAAAPDFADLDPIRALQNTSSKVLIIHSEDDDRVFYKKNTAILQKKITNKNVRFEIVNNKFHHPCFTTDGVKYYKKTFGDFELKLKKKQISSFEEKCAFFKDTDWDFMTEQDPSMVALITRFLS